MAALIRNATTRALIAAAVLATALGGAARPARLRALSSIRVIARGRVRLAEAGTDTDALRATVEKLRRETTALRSEVKAIQEINELAKPRRRPPPPPPPPLAPPAADAAVSNIDLPFGIRLEAEKADKARRAAPAGGDKGDGPIFQLDLETTRLQPVGRLVSTLPYLVPLFDAAVFAPAQDPWIPLLQAAQLYYAIPFATIGFFILFSTLSQNYDLPFAVRFNMRQAIMLDIAISIPSLLGTLLGALTGSTSLVGFAQEVQTVIFYVALVVVVYCQLCNLLGILPKGIPFISEASENSSGPRW